MGGKLVRKTITWIIITIMLMQLAIAIPPLPTEFYGSVTYYNNPAGGKTIYAYYTNDTLCGSFQITTAGYYGLLSCLGDDLSSGSIEGAVDGENISLYVGNQPASMFGDNTWNESEFKQVNLVVPQIRCGDNFCDATESCSLCDLDCGLCQQGEGGTGSGEGGVGGGGGAGGGGGGSVGGGAYPTGDVTYSYGCVEDWICGNWFACTPEEVQIRTCNDRNLCGTFLQKPTEKQACVYYEKPIEEFEDENVTKKTITIKQPIKIEAPKIVCKKETNPLKNNAIWFFLIVLITMAWRIYSMEKDIDEINKKKKLDEFKKAQIKYSIKRKTYIFIGVIIFLTIALYLFYIFFFLCEVNFTAFWILIGIILTLPIVISEVIEFLEYNEHERIVRLQILADTHYKEISKLIDIENSNIKDIEEEIEEKFNFLSKKENFRKLLLQHPALEKIHKEMIKLHKEYEENKVKTKDEKRLVNDIYYLSEKEEFKKLSETEPDFKLIYEKLVFLYQHYQEKQELYEELGKAEEELRARVAGEEPEIKEMPEVDKKETQSSEAVSAPKEKLLSKKEENDEEENENSEQSDENSDKKEES